MIPRQSGFICGFEKKNELEQIPCPTQKGTDCKLTKSTWRQIGCGMDHYAAMLATAVFVVFLEAYQGMMQQNANQTEHIMRAAALEALETT